MAYLDNNEIDPITGKKKKNVALPTQDTNNQQKVKLSDDALNGSNQQVLQTAQKQVLSQPQQPSQLQEAVTQRAQELVDRPMGDYDTEKQKQAQIDQYNADWAKSFENMRRMYGGTSGSGITQEQMLNNIIQRNVDRQTLESSIDQQNFENRLNALTTAIGTGSSVNAANEDVFSQRLANLATTRSMAEGERSQEQAQENALEQMATQQGYTIEQLQEQAKLEQANALELLKTESGLTQENKLEILDKQYQNELTMLDITQDWEGEQNNLNRELETALQANDIEAVRINLQKQLALDEYKFERGLGFSKEQNAMDRALSLTMAADDRYQQEQMLKLKAKIDENAMLRQQDWQSVESSLDRQLQKAIQQNDIAAQESLTVLQGQIAASAQASEQRFQDAQRMATQNWSSSERVSEQDWQEAMAYIDYENQKALQTNDIEAQKYLQEMRNNLELKMQTQDFTQEEKMMHLSTKLNEYIAENDFDRQMQVIKFQTESDLNQMYAEYGQERVTQELQYRYNLALQTKNDAAAQTMQLLDQQFKAREAEKDRALQEIDLQMRQSGMDAATAENEWNMIKDAVSSYSADPSVMTQYLNQLLSDTGITITEPDPIDSYKQITAELDGMKYQFAYGLGDEYKNPDGTLNDLGAQEFNSFYNETMFGKTYGQGVADYETLPTTFSSEADLASLIGKTARVNNEVVDIVNSGHDVGRFYVVVRNDAGQTQVIWL